MNIKEIDLNNLDKTLTLADVITLLGGQVKTYPVIGRTVFLNGQRKAENDVRDQGNISISYEWSSEGKTLTRIYVGHRHIGPMLSCAVDEGGAGEWRNLYGNGNHGKNVSHGGTWSASSRRVYKSPVSALDHRDYEVGGIHHKRRYTEGKAALEELRDFCKNF